MIIDLHNHTQVHSRCSHLDPVDLVIRARRAGLDGLVITEHDALWPRDDVDRLAADHGLLLLRGIEVTTDIGHVLAFGFDRWHEEMKSVEQLRLMAEREGAMVYLAHPMRGWGGHRPPDDELPDVFASVETLNGQEPSHRNAASGDMADAFGLPGIGGSDAHYITWIATAATEFEAGIATEDDFLRELKAGRYRPVDFRASAQRRDPITGR